MVDYTKIWHKKQIKQNVFKKLMQISATCRKGHIVSYSFIFVLKIMQFLFYSSINVTTTYLLKRVGCPNGSFTETYWYHIKKQMCSKRVPLPCLCLHPAFLLFKHRALIREPCVVCGVSWRRALIVYQTDSWR